MQTSPKSRLIGFEPKVHRVTASGLGHATKWCQCELAASCWTSASILQLSLYVLIGSTSLFAHAPPLRHLPGKELGPRTARAPAYSINTCIGNQKLRQETLPAGAFRAISNTNKKALCAQGVQHVSCMSTSFSNISPCRNSRQRVHGLFFQFGG